MEYTFEITVAGCNTNCRHCYVSGDPGPHMPLATYRACLERLVPALDRLEGNVSIAGRRTEAEVDANLQKTLYKSRAIQYNNSCAKVWDFARYSGANCQFGLGALAQLARVPHWQCGSQGFESPKLHHENRLKL